tara:strand:- start:1016 stop:1213 length:198 start_codon:yes stop_codon:yes gene_type:complete
MKSVTPKEVTGWSMSIAQLWGSGPKLTIKCGKCEATFQKRTPMVSNAGLPCPYCNTVNITQFIVD